MTLPTTALCAIASIALALVPSASAAAATTGDLRITVLAEEGRPVVRASITVEARDGNMHQATTEGDGRIVVRGLDPGLYRVSAFASDHVRVVEPAIRVVRDKVVPVELVLRRAEGDVEEMVVVASAIRKDAYGAVSSSYLDREHLRTATGSGADVLRALDGLPGLVSTGEFANFTVRGRGPRDNLILVDGFPYDKVVHFDNSLGEREDIEGGGRFSIFPPNLVSGAEFSPGGWSAAYGGRNGSMLKLDVAKGNPSPSASLRLGLAGAEVVYDGPSGFDADTSFIFSARQFDFGRLFELIGQNDIGNPVMTDWIFKSRTAVDAKNTVELLLLDTPDEYSRDVEHVLQSENLEERELLDTEQDSTLFGATWTRLFGKDGRWENRVFYRNNAKTSREGEAFPFSIPMALLPEQVPIRNNILTLVEREKEFGWRSDLTVANRWGALSAGLRVSALDLAFDTTLAGPWARFEFDNRDFQPAQDARFIVLTPEETNSDFARSEIQYAAYAEQIFERGNWNLRPGIRYEYDGLSAEAYVSPRLSVNRMLSPTTRLSATAGTFYQSPRYLERAADPANFRLENERVQHVSVGIERQLGPQWNVLVEGYYQQLDNLVTEGDAVTGIATNNGEGVSYGVDFVANRQFANGWSANAVYSYNDATQNDNDGRGEYSADYNHKHLLSLGARWEITHRLQLGFRWKYATGRPRDDFTVHRDVFDEASGRLRFSREYIGNNTERWDAFHTLNARIDYRRSVGPVDVVAFLDVLNLYGAAATDEQEFDTATGTFTEEDGDIFPLIGLRFEKTW